MLINSIQGNYQFIAASATYSGGAIALPGHAIVHAVFRRPQPLAQAFESAKKHLAGIGRPMAAICGLEVRSTKPFTFAGFGEFNAKYVALLQEHGLQIDGKGPAARTNVAPEPRLVAPNEASIYAFSYTIPLRIAHPNFVAAGSGELKPGVAGRDGIIRVGEVSPQAMAEKATFVMGALSNSLRELGVTWNDASAVNIYTVHSLDAYLVSHILNPIGSSAIHGAHWFYSRPPIEEIEFEMDVRGVHQELMLS